MFDMRYLRTCASCALVGLTGLMMGNHAWAEGFPAPFTQEAGERGIVFGTVTIDNAGRGMAFVDLDLDGDADFVATGSESSTIGIFENDGNGYFTDRSADAGIPPIPFASGVAAGDYDADGDLDLFFANWGTADVLMRNDGNFSFTNVTGTAGIGDTGGGNSASWADYDGDGWLDLYVGNMTRLDVSLNPNRLWRNQGDGTFVNQAFLLGVDDGNWTWEAVFLDYDRDGDMDIYVSNDKGAAACQWHNYLFENDGTGVFTDITFESGTEACADSMGLGIADFDRNQQLDIYCTNTPSGNPLLLNQGDSTFLEQSVFCGVASFATGWGTIMVDYDNDAWNELYVCNQGAPNRLYDHNGVFPSVNYATPLGVDVGDISYCVTYADIDLDGDLDFAVQNKFEPLRLFINNEGQHESWVRLKVWGNAPNTHAVGTLIDLEAGGVSQIAQVRGGHVYKSFAEMPVHFGLGGATAIDAMTFRWPGGVERTLFGYIANRTWSIYPPNQLGDADLDGNVELDDFTWLVSCQGAVRPGCEIMDLDGDARVDIDDYMLFLQIYDGPLLDCNDNGVLDLEEILVNPAVDQDADGHLDECPQNPGDVNFDGVVDVQDLLAVILNWGPCTGLCVGDVDGDGTVGVLDLVGVILNWG